MGQYKKEKLESLYQEIVSKFLLREASIPGVLFALTKVEISENLNRLTVYISIWPDDKEKNMLEFFEKLKGSLRAHVGDKINPKFIPEIIFKIDDSEKKRMEIERIFKKIK